MQATEIELPKPSQRCRSRLDRCQHLVRSCGRDTKCDRFATHNINDDKFCRQHAGQRALDHIMNNSDRRYLTNAPGGNK